MKMRKRLSGVMAALALGLGSTSAAQTRDLQGVAFAGGTANDGLSAFFGVVQALPGSSLGKGQAIRLSGVGGQFKYTNALGTIDAQFRGAEGALVQQFSGTWGWANISGAVRVFNLSLSPRDPANQRQGTRWDGVVGGDGGFELDPNWRLMWLGSIGVNDGVYLVRGLLSRRVETASETRLGVETNIQGDPNFQTITTGPYITTRVAKRLDVQVTAGTSLQSGRKALPFLGLNVSMLY